MPLLHLFGCRRCLVEGSGGEEDSQERDEGVVGLEVAVQLQVVGRPVAVLMHHRGELLKFSGGTEEGGGRG